MIRGILFFCFFTFICSFYFGKNEKIQFKDKVKKREEKTNSNVIPIKQAGSLKKEVNKPLGVSLDSLKKDKFQRESRVELMAIGQKLGKLLRRGLETKNQYERRKIIKFYMSCFRDKENLAAVKSLCFDHLKRILKV